MINSKLRIGILYGGKSAEHDVSLRSGASVFSAINKSKYAPIPIFITKEGAWYARNVDISSFSPPESLKDEQRLILSPDPGHKGFLRLSSRNCVEAFPVDVIFPVLHGTFGEDGTLQGLLDLADIPYVGCGTLASAVGMDKIVMKSVFRDSGLNIGPFSWFYRSEWLRSPEHILNGLKDRPMPLFIKPANLGSSVGISSVSAFSGLIEAVELASNYDRKILVEDCVIGRELEVSVLGNETPSASLPGEIVSHNIFYNYDEKYLNATAELMIPAKLTEPQVASAQDAALKAYRAVDGSGLARIDMFLTPHDTIIVNEINTLPGFTSISMYPKLWEVSGLTYERLIDNLIDLAIERHGQRRAILTDLKTT